MKSSHVEALRVKAMNDQADTVARLEESVRSLIVAVDAVLQTVTEIRESLQPKAKGKSKPVEADPPVDAVPNDDAPNDAVVSE